MYPHEQLTFARLFVGRIYLVTLAVILFLGFAITQIFGFFAGSPWYFWFNVIFGGLFVLLSFMIAFCATNTAELQEMLDSKADFERLLLQIIESAARDEAPSAQRLLKEYLIQLNPGKADSKAHLGALPTEARSKLYSYCENMIATEKATLARMLADTSAKTDSLTIEHFSGAISHLEKVERLLEELT